MNFAPIVLFVYNRPWHTQQTVEALQKCELAAESDLYIFADGPKEGASDETQQKIAEIRQYIHTVDGFKSIHIQESPTNKGLANSVVQGVSKVVEKHGKVIVVEDDIVVSPGFLKFMNDALETYYDEPKVMHVSGYMYPLKHNRLPDTFFYPAASCWGWATWDRAWKHFCSDAKYLYDQLKENNFIDILNINSIHGFENQLKENIDGTLNTWFIKWNASVVLQGGYSLYPKVSFVQNIGFDNSGEHCETSSLFYCPKLSSSIHVHKQAIVFNQEAIKCLRNYYNQCGDEKSLSRMSKALLRKTKSASKPLRQFVKKVVRKIVAKSLPEIHYLDYLHNQGNEYNLISWIDDSVISDKSKLYPLYHISNSKIGDYTYIAQNSFISMTNIGKFCSIGPNLVCGWGIHPTNGISTSPMFYSTMKQNGMTLSAVDKIEEKKTITIGNDVFIGANVTILDGVNIGDGAVIGAGAVVSKDIPPYAIAIGCPIKVIRYRFEEGQIETLKRIEWWNFPEEKLKNVEKYFCDVNAFLELEGNQG